MPAGITISETLLSLDQFANIMGIPPIHFVQGVSTGYPDDMGCSSVWFQYTWQAPGKASREELARAIANAEAMIAQLMGFWPAPKWLEDTRKPYPRQSSRWDTTHMYHCGRAIETEWGRVIAGGRRKVDAIALNVAVTYPVDLDTGMATLATTWVGAIPQQAEEVAVFPSTDTQPQLRIRDLEVSIGAGGVVSIRGRPARFVDPALWELPGPIDGDALASYLTTVNIYRVYNSTDGNDYAPAEFGWQTYASTSLVTDYGILRDWTPGSGMVTPVPATWDGSVWTPTVCLPCWEMRTVQLFYLAGVPRDTFGRIADPFARAIAALATALLTDPVCGCSQAEKMSTWWQSAPQPREQVAYGQLNCPWGVKRGAWEAYRLLTAFWSGAGGIGL